MPAVITILTVATSGKGMTEITYDIAAWLADQTPDGLLTVFCRHTSASLLIQENAAPAVQRDIVRWLDRLAPEGDDYEHDDEGPDDMPAHLRSLLTGNSLSIPVSGGRMMLGIWQGVYLFEHRRAPYRRQVILQLLS